MCINNSKQFVNNTDLKLFINIVINCNNDN